MKKLLAVVVCSFAAILSGLAQPVATSLSATTYSQNFNAMTNGSSTILPAGWGINPATTYGGAVTGIGLTAGSTGTGAFNSSSQGQSYLMIHGARDIGTDKAIGYLSSSGFTDNRNILFAFVNNSGAAIADLELAWNYEKYRMGTATRAWTFFASTNDASWGSAIAAGGYSYAADAVNGTAVHPPLSAPISLTLTNLNIPEGVTFYLRWNYDGSGTGASAQALAIDDFTLTAFAAQPRSGPPTISTQPANQTVWAGTNVTFAVTASGAEPLSYQWYFNGNPIADATTSVYVVANVIAANAGGYHVVMTNPEDSLTSDTASLTVQSPVGSTIAGVRSLVDSVNWLPSDTNNLFQVEGVVTTHVNLSTPADGSCFIQDATGGISLYVTGGASFRPQAGDRIRAVGRLGHANGLLQFQVTAGNPTHAVEIISADNPLPNPSVLGFADQLNIPQIESLEGSRVVISNVYIDLSSSTFAAGTTVRLTNAFDSAQTFDLRIDSRVSDFDGQTRPPGVVTVIGVLGQFAGNDPRTNGYQIMSTRFADVLVGPAITSHPQHQSAIVGDAVTMSVNATGPGTLQYQWRRNGVEISGATTATYSIPSAALPDNGRYTVSVSNESATVPSVEAILSVGNGSVSLLTYNVKGNFSGDFSTNSAQVQAIGREFAYLQPDIITLNEVPNGSTHEITNLVNHYLPGYFWATNSGTDGAIRSVVLSRWRVLRSDKWLDGADLSTHGYAGNFTRDLFEAQVEVPGFLQPLHVFTTHLKSSSDLDSSTKRAAEASAISNFLVTAFLPANSDHPYVLTGDLNEDINRPPANSLGPIQRLQNSATGLQLLSPMNPFTGDERTFSIQALPLQHRYDYILPCSSLSAHVSTSQVFRTDVLVPLPPELNANDSAMAGDHLPVYVRFSNPFNVAPIILSNPEDKTAVPGATVTFEVQAASAVPMTFRWKKGDEELSDVGNIAGSGTATLTLSAVNTDDMGAYSVIVSNLYGAVTSTEATLSLAIAPGITSEPLSQTNVVGGTASFNVIADGSAPLAYQWKKNSNPLTNGGKVSGATSATLTIINLSESDSGVFSVMVTNSAGSVESSIATLTVVTPPTITTQPVSRTVGEHGAVTLTVAANGTAPLTYQWFRNSDSVPDATNNSYTIADASKADAGHYFAVVENVGGAATSSVARVQVALPQIPLFNTNIVVLRLGDGVQTLSAFGNGAYLDQFAPDGTYLGTLSIPENGDSAVILAGNATSEGSLARSADGFHLTFAGYNTNRQTSGSISSASASSVPRAVGQVNAFGSFAMALETSSNYSGGSFRGAVTDGLNNYWGAGANSGTFYLGLEGAVASVQNTVANTRAIYTFNGSLYFSTGSGSNPGIFKLGGYPKTASSIVPFLSTGVPSSPYGFYINADETTVYVADDSSVGNGGGVQRWDKVGGVWTRSYILQTGANVGARGVVADFSGAFPIVYATTAENTSNRVIRIVDAGAGSPAVTIGTSTANQAFRGIQFGPEMPISPSIVSGPVSLSLLQGETVSFGVTATGSTPLRYQWFKDGVAIPGATVPTFSIPAALPALAGAYSVVVSNLAGSIESDPATLSVAADPLAPALKVISPKANAVYNSELLSIGGTVVETVRLKNVQYKLNEAEYAAAETHFVAARQPTNWNAAVTLNAGTNVVTVIATDLAGNSITNGPIRFFYHTASPLTVVKTLDGGDPETNHVGTLLTNTIPSSLYSGNSTNLYVGRTYTLKAVESGLPRYILTNWTATWEGQPTPVLVQTNNLICVFEMKSNMVLKANFISNPFYRFGGAYHGLFSATNQLEFRSAGFAQLKVTEKQALSGKVFIDGNAISISGKLKIDGTGTIATKARTKVTDKPELIINIGLDFTGTETLSGTITEMNGTWVSDLVAHRAVWSTNVDGTLATQYTNSYTFLLPGFEDLNGPAGSSYQLVTLDRLGKVKGSGHSADGHVMKGATVVSKNGDWPYFSPQYKQGRTNTLGKRIGETRGFVMGWLNFATNGLGHMAPTGELHWIKSPWTNTTYAAGFTNSGDISGSRWLAPIPKSGNRAVNMTEVTLSFAEGGLGANAFDATYFVTTNTTLAVIKPADSKDLSVYYPRSVKASLTAKSGLIKGTFIHPDLPPGARPSVWYGAMLQDQNFGEGFFVGPTLAGKVDAQVKALEVPGAE